MCPSSALDSKGPSMVRNGFWLSKHPSPHRIICLPQRVGPTHDARAVSRVALEIEKFTKTVNLVSAPLRLSKMWRHRWSAYISLRSRGLNDPDTPQSFCLIRNQTTVKQCLLLLSFYLAKCTMLSPRFRYTESNIASCYSYPLLAHQITNTELIMTAINKTFTELVECLVLSASWKPMIYSCMTVEVSEVMKNLFGYGICDLNVLLKES